MSEVCEHGNLKRKCQICDLTEEVVELRTKVAELESDFTSIEELNRARNECDHALDNLKAETANHREDLDTLQGYKEDLEYIAEMDGDYEIWDAVQAARSSLGLDSDGKPAPFKSGDRVIFLPEKVLGTVEKQTLHYDCNERFWGNLYLKMDDGQRIHCNCWQTRKVDENDTRTS